MISVLGFACLQMVLSTVLGFIHGGILGYFVAVISIIGTLSIALAVGYSMHEIKVKVDARSTETETKETDIHESGMD